MHNNSLTYINAFGLLFEPVKITKVITESNHFLSFQQCCVCLIKVYQYACIQD